MKNYLKRVFIDGLSGMAYGLFSTLIIGTIISQFAKLIGDNQVGYYLNIIATSAKLLTGAGIGVGVACKLKASPLTAVSAAVCGMVGSFSLASGQGFVPGELIEPFGAFVAAYIAVEVGYLVSGKTKFDIILTPISCILSGCAVGFFVSPYISTAMRWVGSIVNYNVDKSPIIGGIIVSVVMGMLLTLPISSAAIATSIGIGGIAAGAATIGCCCNMVGFAVISYRENRMSGLISQGIGTSMVQMPNIVRHPLIWLPSIIASAILGPISSAVLGMVSADTGAGMGSAGLVGQFVCYDTMINADFTPVVALLEIVLMHFVLPAIICLAVSEAMRKLKLIKSGDLKLVSADD